MSDRIHAITMPKWGMTMTEGTVTGWLAQVGDQVEAGSDVVEIETTKIANVMEVHASGILCRLLVDDGATVPVGTLLGVVAALDVADQAIEEFISGYEPPAFGDDEDDATGSGARLIAAAGHTINVLSQGAGDDAVVLIHGFGGDLNSWMFNQLSLAEDYCVHAVDLPGHGASSQDVGSGAVTDLAEAVSAALDQLDVSAAHLVGHSLGGALSLYLAINQPERVVTLTLICPVGLGPEINLEFIEGFIAADRRKPMKDVLGLLFSDAGAVQRKMVEQTLNYKRLDGVAEALRKVADGNFSRPGQPSNMRESLCALTMPVQILWGREDQIIPVTQTEDLPPNVRVHVIEQAGHMPHMEQPRTVNQLISDFIAAAAG